MTNAVLIELNIMDTFQYIKIKLRTIVPLVSYIRSSLRFWYYASLSTCCQNLEKKFGVNGKIWEKGGVKLLSDLTEKSIILVLW